MSPNNTPLSPATYAVHADDRINTVTDVAPPIHPSTTFRYPRNPGQLQPVPKGSEEHVNLTTPLIYSRLASSSTNRLETILAPLLYPDSPPSSYESLGNHAVTYTSGLSAFHALLVNVVPKVIAISGGYHGCHGVISLHTKMHNLRTVDLHADESAWDAAGLGNGDIVHLETPLNPTGEAYSIAHFAARAHARGALLSVDATFGPPGLQNPFALGADIVMHSGTKYIGGHSDMLCGVLATAPTPEGYKRALTLRDERIFLGSVLGSLEGWLGVRSLRTLALRVQRQSESATNIVSWIHSALNSTSTSPEFALVRKVISRVTHASLQASTSDVKWLQEQMPNGYGPVFSIYTHTPAQARSLPSHLALFHHATSLGGVESLIEWRRMSDGGVDERLLRVSIGVEDWRDLKADLLAAFEVLADGGAKGSDEATKEVVVQTGGRPAEVAGAADGSI